MTAREERDVATIHRMIGEIRAQFEDQQLKHTLIVNRLKAVEADHAEDLRIKIAAATEHLVRENELLREHVAGYKRAAESLQASMAGLNDTLARALRERDALKEELARKNEATDGAIPHKLVLKIIMVLHPDRTSTAAEREEMLKELNAWRDAQKKR